ncbi:CCA tRNA nucleotidyltransferase, mitochondrial [Imshaugia aleurites]|uniref:CCA tRNA nucleotidyltransferase, mitochondrial n=1 Tax=Imshaugia aleurites TaxID=172621 RepID=A0A8H3FT00_9LECA|nr:CCA tRNA nucleotidyltransferase, mitochondrial [Imshaugia aleurites]
MSKSIQLTEREATLRQLLLDVSSYAVTRGDHHTKPELRFAGGWVRDKLLGLSSKDIDVAISNMTGSDFGSLMKQYVELPQARDNYEQDILGRVAKIEANPEKSKHLETATTKVLGFDIDLVNLRKETYTNDSRNPIVEFGTPEEDALRRDSTINALFYNLQTFEVEDFTGRGFQDMERKLIKTPLAPLQTFNDDPLRVLRSIRFASRLMYEIAPEDEMAMSDRAIKAALRLKITRDRVRVEILKMLGWPEPDQSLSLLRGPGPHKALCLIDRLGLYNEVFTDPTDADCKLVDTANWHRAYDQLRDIIQAGSKGSKLPKSIETVRSILLGSPEDLYHAWILTCFVPWAREPPKSRQKSSKRPMSAAGLAAREGIKAENKICRLVDDAVFHLQDIVEKKGAICHEDQTTPLPSTRDPGVSAGAQREIQGLAIRKWGSSWRSSVMYALLTEIAETKTETDSGAVLDGYSSWLSHLSSLNLLHVDQLEPIVKGDELMKVFNTKGGKWVSAALDLEIQWQLRNPDRKDAAGAIAEVVQRKDELNIPP